MVIRKAFKYRLKPTPGMTARMARQAGACRFVWNKILAMNQSRYLFGHRRLTFNEACWWLTFWKQTEELRWLNQVHSQVLQQCLRDLERAYLNLFQGRALPPVFRKKGLADSFRFPQGFKFDNRKIYLPKLGWVEFWKSRELEGTAKNVTVSRRGTHWDVSVQVETEASEPVHPAEDQEIGIDLGIDTLLPSRRAYWFHH